MPCGLATAAPLSGDGIMQMLQRRGDGGWHRARPSAPVPPYLRPSLASGGGRRVGPDETRRLAITRPCCGATPRRGRRAGPRGPSSAGARRSAVTRTVTCCVDDRLRRVSVGGEISFSGDTIMYGGIELARELVRSESATHQVFRSPAAEAPIHETVRRSPSWAVDHPVSELPHCADCDYPARELWSCSGV